MGENPQGQGSGRSLKRGKHGSQRDCENGGTWAGHVVHWMPRASTFLSVSWAQDSPGFLVIILDPELASSCPLHFPLQGP